MEYVENLKKNLINMRNFSVIFKPIRAYDFFATMRLFLIKDGAFISPCV